MITTTMITIRRAHTEANSPRNAPPPTNPKTLNIARAPTMTTMRTMTTTAIASWYCGYRRGGAQAGGAP
jgi:hypothetical protein